MARTVAPGTTALLVAAANGSLDPAGATVFLETMRKTLRDDDTLVIGADLVKPERDLLLAYDDPLGVTATPQRPSAQYLFPFPVDTGRIRSRAPSRHRNSTWRLRSISTRSGPPSANMAVGRVAVVAVVVAVVVHPRAPASIAGWAIRPVDRVVVQTMDWATPQRGQRGWIAQLPARGERWLTLLPSPRMNISDG